MVSLFGLVVPVLMDVRKDVSNPVLPHGASLAKAHMPGRPTKCDKINARKEHFKVFIV